MGWSGEVDGTVQVRWGCTGRAVGVKEIVPEFGFLINGASIPTELKAPEYLSHYLRTLLDSYNATVDIESEPEEAPSETEEFEASEPSDTRITSSYSIASSESTTPTARMAVRTQPTLSPGMSARITKTAALSSSLFCKRCRSSYETSSPSSSPILPIWKRYQGTSELVEDTNDESSDSNTKKEGSEDEDPGSEDEGHGSEDEGPGLEDKEEAAAPEGQQQTVLVVDTATDETLGLGYRALRRRELELKEGSVPKIMVDVPPARVRVQTPPSPEWSSGSLPVSPLSLTVPTLVALPVTTRAATIAVGEDEFLEVRDVRDDIFSQHYMLTSLEQDQERATVTFGAIWRLVLTLESWAGYVEAQRVEMWNSILVDPVHTFISLSSMWNLKDIHVAILCYTLERND
nr:hypothetical protein [Tanacetum cinerariifolium]